MKPLTPEQANAVYDILVQECGAWDRDYERQNFVMNQTTEEVPEWRFCGKLGFGGKFWNNCGRRYVTCYREDENPERLKMIEAANKRLAAL